MKKQSFLYGSVVLIVSALLTKVVGALYKIPLTNLLEGTGMGYFGCAYGLFLPLYALSVTGMTTAVAKLTAEHAASGAYGTVRRIKKLSLFWFSLIGLGGTLLMLLLARPFCRIGAANPQAELSVLALAPAVLCGCVSAVYRGYYEGLRNMYPTALSQLMEAVVKLAAGLWLCSRTLRHGDAVLSHLPAGTSLMSAASAGAVLGVSLSTMVCMLYFIVSDRLRGDALPQKNVRDSAPMISSGTLVRALFGILIPVAAGSLVTNLTTLIDLATGIRCLNTAISRAPLLFAARFPDASGEDPGALANFLFGSFTGLSITVFNLVPSVTNMFGKSILPAVTHAHARRDSAGVRLHAEAVLRATAFLAVPSGIGIAVLSPQILRFLYPQRFTEIVAAAPALRWLSGGMICLCLAFPVFSMLQAVGRADLPVKCMLAGVLVKLVGNLCLMPLPAFGVSGAAMATTLCYALILICTLRAFARVTGVPLRLGRLLFPPAYAGALCAAAATLCDSLLVARIGARPALAAALLVGGGVYLFAMWLMGQLPQRAETAVPVCTSGQKGTLSIARS